MSWVGLPEVGLRPCQPPDRAEPALDATGGWCPGIMFFLLAWKFPELSMPAGVPTRSCIDNGGRSYLDAFLPFGTRQRRLVCETRREGGPRARGSYTSLGARDPSTSVNRTRTRTTPPTCMSAGSPVAGLVPECELSRRQYGTAEPGPRDLPPTWGFTAYDAC